MSFSSNEKCCHASYARESRRGFAVHRTGLAQRKTKSQIFHAVFEGKYLGFIYARSLSDVIALC